MRAITGTTRLVGLMGWPVAHSLSPVLHNAAFEALGLDFRYVVLPVRPERVGDAVRGLRALGFAGGNVTVPHKVAVLEHLDELTPFAKRSGAVNTIWLEQSGAIHGDNTDGPGLVRYLATEGVGVRGNRVLVIGAGGSARAVVAALTEGGCASIIIANRTARRAEALAEEMATSSCVIRAAGFPQDLALVAPEAELIIQCTTLGMGASNTLAWDPRVPLGPAQVVCDLVYAPRVTPLLALASAGGARALGGMGMLVHQAALAFERWTGRAAPIEVMYDSLSEVAQP